MAKWSGRGIPPTRRKLHRWRQALLKQRQADRREEKGNAGRREQSWQKQTRGAIINPARFEEMWG